ncbi:uncharacterized protein si:dkey-112e17.1 [Acanthochromis polyacanthus]|uniref:uncharacterized protein si:dkey-112e17.1 n=1 Tax=Acanthochromis polyacanthus TaxID=80966 RepID=UPI000B900C7D|nr:uncharacterized protein si:dkey-112e17.1 [Acanthochromis polyacanthus]
MSCATSLGAHVFMTAYLLFVVGCVAQKVYFDCGAKVDVVDVQGLILSPGFPYNYSSGTHCVWQFVVPIDYQLILEIFDFDIFESHDSAQYSAISDFEEEEVDEEETFIPGSLAADETSSEAKDPVLQSASKTQQSSQDGEVKQVVVQEQSTKMEIAKVLNSAKRSADASSSLSSPPSPSLLLLPGGVPPGDKAVNSASSPHLRGDLNPDSNPSTAVEETTLASPHSTDTTAVSPETQQSVLDACPHDVLYISDLITFSSRFCGSNRPPSSQLVFGSSQEMVEVIMELITTTHWGRGFALLFHYHNLTKPGGDRRAMAPTASKVDSLLAAVSGAAFFALILTSAFCIIFRPKLCPKRASSCASSNSEVQEGVQNTRAEVSELQLMAENQANLDMTTEQDNDSPPHTASAGAEVSQNAEVDLSCSGLTELDLGADEVFIVSSAPSPSGLPFSPHTQRERFLRHSDTGPGPSGDWPSPDSNTSPTGARSIKDSSSGCARPRAWSVRTFQDFLPPLPQLHKKWCSWNSTSPFTKLVDSAPSTLVADCRAGDSRKVFSDVHLDTNPDTSTISDSSNASYPLTQAAQRQRRLNSTSNLRRSRFTGPCFGLLSGTADQAKASGVLRAPGSPSEPSSGSPSSPHCQIENNQAGKRRDFPGEADHISVPVFAISEEEDRQPLVSAEHLDQTAASAVLNGLIRGTYEGKRPAVESTSLSPQRARPEWRPWGSQASGGVGPLPSSAVTESTPVSDSQPPLSLSTGLCSVTNQM